MTREELLAKIEAATGPDRELDWDLQQELFGIDAVGFHETPRYTESILAAFGLVERLLPDLSADITRYRNGKGTCRLWRSDPTHPGLHITVADSDEQNATVPLAILDALLRALPPSNEAER